jgi:hypothetical protein
MTGQTLRRIAFVAFLPAMLCAETGMGLIVNAYRDQYGPIYRIDLKDGQVIHTEKNLGITEGICPRFSPDGTRFAYAPKAKEIRICKLDGQQVKSIPVTEFSRSMSALSWTQDNFIWATAPRHTFVVKYNIETGEKVAQKNFSPDVGNGAYVSRNEETLAWNSYNQSYNPDYQRFVMDMATSKITRLGAGCAVSVSPNGQYILCNNASYNGHSAHTSMSIFLKDGTRYKDYYRETMLDWPAFQDPGNHGTWNRMVWSGNSNDVFCLTAGLDVKRYNALPWIYNMADDTAYCLYAGDKNDEIRWWWCFDFYVGKLPGPLPPAIKLDTDSIGFSATKDGANPAALSVTVTNKGDGTLSGVAATDDAAWLTVNVTDKGSQTWTIANTVNIAGLASGTHTATVTVSADSAANVVYKVMLTALAEAALTSLHVTPSTAYIAPGGTRDFSVEGRDQFGKQFDIGTVTWSANGGGTINSSGLFTAGSSEGGPFTVKAAFGSLAGTATVLVTKSNPVYVRINCGSNSFFVNGWGIDDLYARNGADRNADGDVKADGIDNAAAADIYKSAYGGASHSYSIGAELVPNGTYTVRLHLADSESKTRSITYRMEGEQVASGINIANEAGGINRALVRDFVVTVSDSNGLQIECAGSNGDEPKECGIEVFTDGAQPAMLVIEKPAGNESYVAGDTLVVRWKWTGGTKFDGAVVVEFSPDGGLAWHQINEGHSIGPGTGNWGNFTWKIGNVGDNIAPVSSGNAMVRLKEYERYDLPGYTAISDRFSVRASNALVKRRTAGGRKGFATSRRGRSVIVYIGGNDSYAARMIDMQGRTVWATRGKALRTCALPGSACRPGIYVLKVSAGAYRLQTKVIFSR